MEGVAAYRLFGTLLRQSAVGLWLGGSSKVHVQGFAEPYSGFEPCAAVGFTAKFEVNTRDDLVGFIEFVKRADRRVYVLLNYDLGGVLEPCSFGHLNGTGSPLAIAFLPEFEFRQQNDGSFSVFDHSTNKVLEINLFESILGNGADLGALSDVKFQKPLWAAYKTQFDHIQQYLHRGDIYEVNYCVRHSVCLPKLDVIDLYSRLLDYEFGPMKCLVQVNNKRAASISPERFMRGDSRKIYAQPMKGTAPRMENNKFEDSARLRDDIKERAENLMITDLTRNDLSKVAQKGTVRVEELCGVYPFGAVNQMISTVSCQLRPNFHPIEAVLAAFPMGSMTGAPKIRSMEVINQTEDFQRGLFSGSVGYFDPDGSFDLNVMIRTLFVDSDSGEAHIPTGGAITVRSTAEAEFEECLLKANTLINLLTK